MAHERDTMVQLFTTNVFARAVFLKLAAVLQADTVVARLYVAIGYAHMAGVVNVNAVAIANLQIIQNGNTIDERIVTTYEMHGPIGTVADGDVAYAQLLHIGKGKYMRTGVKICHRFQFV